MKSMTFTLQRTLFTRPPIATHCKKELKDTKINQPSANIKKPRTHKTKYLLQCVNRYFVAQWMPKPS